MHIYGVLHNEVGGHIIVMYFRATMVNNKNKYYGCFCYLFKRLDMKMGIRNSRLALCVLSFEQNKKSSSARLSVILLSFAFFPFFYKKSGARTIPSFIA